MGAALSFLSRGMFVYVFSFLWFFRTILALHECPVFCAYICLFDLAPVCQIRGFSQMSGDPWFLFISEHEAKGLQRDLYAWVELVHPCGLNGQRLALHPEASLSHTCQFLNFVQGRFHFSRGNFCLEILELGDGARFPPSGGDFDFCLPFGCVYYPPPDVPPTSGCA